MLVYKDLVDPDKPGVASDAFKEYTDGDNWNGVKTFGPIPQKYYDEDNKPVSDAVYSEMSAEEKGYVEKKFSFVVSNNLEQISMEGNNKKQQKKLLKPAFVKYFKAGLNKKFGDGKSAKKKDYKKAAGADDGILGAKGFVVAKILADPTEFDYFCAPEKVGEALSGESAIVVCEWTGAADAIFHVMDVALKEEKY